MENSFEPVWLKKLLLLAMSLCIAGFSFAQDRTITGKVTSAEDGSGIPGVNILVEGTTSGTVTDLEGSYRLSVPEGAALLYSSIGYRTQRIVIGNQTVIDVSMATDVTQLSEVVVTGYGTQERGDVTAAISSLNMEEIQSVPITNINQAFQGRVPGLTVTNTSGGQPGGAAQVNIRGIGTFNSETPLYVIDGIPIKESGQSDLGYSFLNNLNPNDIESIDILKDASAAAIYGSRASGGVILITTKRGKSGPVRVDLDAYYGTQTMNNFHEVLDADGYANYIRELHSQPNANIPPAFANGAVPSNTDTDWQRELFQNTAPIQNYNLSLAGGNENATFSVGLGYFDQVGNVRATEFDRWSMRVNSDFKVGKKIKIGESILLSKTYRKRIENQGGRREQEHAIKQSPFVSVYDDTFKGGYGWPDTDEGQDARNPVADQELYTRDEDRYRFFGSMYGEWEIIEGLTYRAVFGLEFAYENNLTYNPEYVQVRRQTTFSSINRYKAQSFNPLFENYLTYTKSIGDHNFSAMVGYSAQEFNFESQNGSGEQLPPNVISLNAATVNIRATDGFGQSALASLFGRVTYAYKSKYLLTANIRRDESSKLYRGNNPTGVFPSASVGWRVSEESFMSNVGWISDLKLRGGYGEIGNQDPLGNYPTDVNLNTNIFYVIGGQAVQGISQTTLANPNITWETTSTLDFGIDAGLFNNRVLLVFDWYKRNTTDLIWGQQVPPSVGLGPASVNAGEIENKGIELSLTYRDSEGDFQWDISGNMTTVQNKVISLVNPDLEIYGDNPVDDISAHQRTYVGQSIGQFYGYVSDGIFRNWDEVYNWAYINQANTGESINGIPVMDPTQRDATVATTRTAPGDIKWVDTNGDGVVNADDRVDLGSPIPSFVYGATFNASWKGFDLQIFAQGQEGNKVFNVATRWLKDYRQNFNVGATAANATAYRPEYNASEPRLVIADPNQNILRSSDRYVEDASYMRLKNFTLGYSFNRNIQDKLNATKLRVYFTTQNLITITNYSGLEPEIGSFSSGTARDFGTDRLQYPQPKTFIVGVQVGF
jgi:TonB-dependent starch-binding outer membrane protein SusC